MKVAVVYNMKKKAHNSQLPADFYSEFDSEKTVRAIQDALAGGGNEVSLIEADSHFLENILKNRDRIDIAFNIAEGEGGTSRESRVPAILDYVGIPYTGSGVLSLTVGLDKAASKKLFRYEKIPTPNFQLFSSSRDKLDESLKFPLIVKPNCEGSAKGISTASVVNDEAHLREQIEKVSESYSQDAIVEEFIEGRELTVGVLDGAELKALPILEIDFSNCRESGEYFYSWRMKEYQGDLSQHLDPQFYCPARLDEKTARGIMDIAKRSHAALGCCDFSRTDIRLSVDGVPYVLEVNPLPGLDPTDSNFTYIAKAAGIEYAKLINTILHNAVERYNRKKEGINWQKRDGGTSICGRTLQKTSGRIGAGS